MNQPPVQGRKKVLFLITKATWGGAQRYVYDLATHFPAEEFEATVAFGDSGRLSSMLKEKNIPTSELPSLSRDVALFSDVKSFFALYRLLKNQKPDVVHLNSSKAAALGALAARICGIKRIVFTAHGWPFKEDRGAIAKLLIYLISWFTALLSSVTIVVSKRDETIGKRMPFVGNKIRYIPLGIESPDFLSREAAAAKLKISAKEARIVTIAELTTNKGIAYAIDAIADLKKRKMLVEYFIIGDGELRSELEAQARARNISNQVHFLGFVEHASTYLKAFDVFVLPSVKEGMPYVLLEAVAAGLPVVATDAVDTAFCMQVPSQNAQELASGIKKLLRIHVTAKHQRIEDMLEHTAALY